MVSCSEEAMRVHVHTRFCFLCVVTVLFHQCSHCHGNSHHHAHAHGGHDHNDLQISQTPYLQTGGPSKPPEDEAVSEQQFYIQQLFRRYGDRDHLDFGGFQSLLHSLGLGQVRLVELEHDDLGHDHVAHLDMLDVQEGHHSHGPSHPHNHQHAHPKTHTEQEENQLVASPCTRKAGWKHKNPTARPTTKSDLSHDDHDHGHSHSGHHRNELQPNDREHHHKHLHKHNRTESSMVHQTQPHNATDLEHPKQHLEVQPSQVPLPSDTRTKRPRKPSKNKGLRTKSRGDPTLTPAPLPPQDSLLPTDLGGVVKLRPIEKLESASNQERDQNDAHGQDLGHGEMRLRVHKREIPDNPLHMAPEALAGHHVGKTHQHDECLNLTLLLQHYGLSPESLISPTEFTYLCPALLYQIDSRACIRKSHQVDVHPSTLEPPRSEVSGPSSSAVWIWVWGFTSVTIISLLSLLGIVLVPIINQSCFKFLLTFLVALAVGTLSGDALLHLLPHSQGEHDHSHNTSLEEEGDLLTKFDGVWKGLTALAGIYLLFIIEHCIGLVKHYRNLGEGWCRKMRKGDEANIGRKLSDHKLNRRSDAEWMHLKPLTAEGSDSSVLACDSQHNGSQLSDRLDPESSCEKAKENGRKAKTKKHSHGHGHSHSHCHSDQQMKDAGIASIAWMVIMGDGMHNFSDGLAIGAAFSANVTGGISTSVAVFCHELPHELGDFAVLLKAGMSVKQAIVYNLLSALMAYVGVLIGTAVGQYTHSLTSWIFAITAGMFLYVALVDMLPEMLHGDSEDHKRCQLSHFLLQNLGMLTGFTIMLLIAIFEHRIVLDLGF